MWLNNMVLTPPAETQKYNLKTIDSYPAFGD